MDHVGLKESAVAAHGVPASAVGSVCLHSRYRLYIGTGVNIQASS